MQVQLETAGRDHVSQSQVVSFTGADMIIRYALGGIPHVSNPWPPGFSLEVVTRA